MPPDVRFVYKDSTSADSPNLRIRQALRGWDFNGSRLWPYLTQETELIQSSRCPGECLGARGGFLFSLAVGSIPKLDLFNYPVCVLPDILVMETLVKQSFLPGKGL